MAVFKALAAIGIGRSELTKIGMDDAVRIEKRLIAESKLHNTVSKNDIEQTIRIIREYPDVLKAIANYECFYGILAGYDADRIDKLDLTDGNLVSRITYAVSNYLRDEILEYLNANIRKNDWNNLRVLIFYKVFFENDIVRDIAVRLDGKLEYLLTELGKKPAYSVLKKKLGDFSNEDFFVLLGETNSLYFGRNIQRLIKFISDDQRYTRNDFFEKIVEGILYYALKNQSLAPNARKMFQVWNNQRLQSKGQKYLYTFLLCILFLITAGIVKCSSDPPEYAQRRNFWEDMNNRGIARAAYNAEDQRLKMEDFIEARLYTQNYPLSSWKNAKLDLNKYDAPFSLDIFSDNDLIKNGGDQICIFNHTDKDCIVIAYFNRLYNPYQKKYLGDYRHLKLFALYIPPHDSIGFDNQMSILRFYMGRRLSAFNSYRRYIYPDSLDLKFSEFKPVDSVLFSKGIVFDVNQRPRPAQQNLIITQPDQLTYHINWTGKQRAWLYQKFGFVDTLNADTLQGTAKKQPDVFIFRYSSKAAKNDGYRSPDSVIDPFINGP